MDNLTGRRVLVTNVGVGPGRAMVAELARRGACVAIQHAYNERDANESAARISVMTGRKPAIVQADLLHVSECDRAVEEAAQALGGLDMLVNNAGAVHPRDFLDTDEAVFDEVFGLNVKCYLFCAERAVPFMQEAGGGSIVNVSCIHGHGGLPPRAAYAATEGAVISITRELAAEWSDSPWVSAARRRSSLWDRCGLRSGCRWHSRSGGLWPARGPPLVRGGLRLALLVVATDLLAAFSY
jgi:NAD(P)-dependent dehydrogenase (short-subunit alcohol dehydrogenase family)